MARRTLKSLIANESGAVAATYALALFALIGIAGLGYDYSRLVTVDTEMQNAADEAAIAAATQLDGKSDAITRAKAAVDNYFAKPTSTLVNRSLLANDGAGSALTGVTYTFYTSYDSATDTLGSATTTGSQAKVVNVQINARQAFFALTPIVGALTNSTVAANALAGQQASTCKLPPIMVCGPSGSSFPTSADIGKGLLLKLASTTWFPGNFGYLDFGNGGNTVKQLMGSPALADSCVAGSTLTSEPGNIASATDYLNTRFDIYTNPLTPADCTAKDYCPAKSARKDLLRQEEYSYKNQSSAPARPACNSAAVTNNGAGVKVTEWVQLPSGSLPASNAVQGFPRDTCHYSGTCPNGNIGDGTWDIAGYRTAHPSVPNNFTTRYDIYKWERDNPSSGLQSQLVNSGDPVKATGCKNGKCDYTWTNYCSYPSPIKATSLPSAKDRRLMTVAVVDCTGASGKSTLAVKNWMDVFLTEPSWNRGSPATSNMDIYGEVVSVGTRPDGSNAFQYYSRNKVVLLR